MHGAAEKGHDVIVKILISHEADVNAVTVVSALNNMYKMNYCFNVQKEQSPLHLAAEYGHVVVTETLIESGGNMEAATRVQ